MNHSVSKSKKLALPEALPKPSYSFLKKNTVVCERFSDHTYLILYTETTPKIAISELYRYYFTSFPLAKGVSKQVSQEEFEVSLNSAFDGHNSETIQNVGSIENEVDLDQLMESIPETEDLLETEDEAPIIKLINAVFTEAVKLNASDIHIETYETKMVIRFRIDGALQNILEPKRAMAPLLVSRIKIMAKLDIAEKRIPQDGRISLRVSGKGIDVRVSTLPSANNERVVMRILDTQTGQRQLSSLGMDTKIEGDFSALLHRPHGIIFVTGPTGSGKTTSLYSGLSHINSQERNILTIEDPIEYQLEGIGQTQVNVKTDMTFARGLRAILRQDPDVMMIGEIRDRETAEIAVQASLTGHLVLSTLHTNTAVGAITRLKDMGVEPFLISSSTIGIMAQRLVRTLCDNCKEEKETDESEQQLFKKAHIKVTTIFVAKGCTLCKNQGYIGRTGIYELISIDETLRSLIHNDSSEDTILNSARKNSKSILDDGLRLVKQGLTTIDEVIRVTHD